MLKAISRKNWRSNNRVWSVAAAVMVLLCLVFSRPAATRGQNQPPDNEAATPAAKINITSDRVVVDNDKRTAEFSGQVRASQGTTVITSNVLTIFYRPTSESDTQDPASGDAIDRIIATGDVKILFDDKVATTATAEYRMDTRVLVLSGPDSKIVSTNNSITGAKITFYRADERVIVEGQEGKRVEAEFYTKENGLQ
jgi:lipopolysaccharide export system protein LptA